MVGAGLRYALTVRILGYGSLQVDQSLIGSSTVQERSAKQDVSLGVCTLGAPRNFWLGFDPFISGRLLFSLESHPFPLV